MEKYDFTLYFRDFDVMRDEILERLYESGFDDGTFGERDGLQYVALHRRGSSFAATVVSAIQALEGELPELRVVAVDGDELITAREIAARTGRTRESVRLLIEGKRGPGGFPPAAPWVSAGRTRLYEWAEVAAWFSQALGEPIPESEHARFVAALNGALTVRYRATQLANPAEREAVASIVRQDAELLAAS